MSMGPLKFLLRWDVSDNHVNRLTTASLSILLDEETVWPVGGAPKVGLEIQIDDFLSYLTDFWKPIVLRQTYPIPVAPERPSLLRHVAEERWETQPMEVAEREDVRIIAFEEAHDLSRCFAGLYDLPPLWLLRAGERMLVETRTALRSVAFDAALHGLSNVGNEIANRLCASGIDRWTRLIDAWRARDHGEPAVLLAWSASLDREVARTFVGDGTLSAPSSVTDASNDDDELRIAARMASALPPEQIRQIVGHVREFAKQPAPHLDVLANRAQTYIRREFACHRAHQQGEAAAAFIRQELNLATVQFVDIFSLVKGFGVVVHIKNVEPPTLDGVAAWGSRHGPAVLLNEGSKRVGRGGDLSRSAPARVTLAHEFCHLLLDRGHALSAIDVLNSRMPLDVERRAKAFAGEFLLPGRVAADNWIQSGKPEAIVELRGFLDRLGRKYGVSRSVAAWKLEHGLYRHDIDLRHPLDLAVPSRYGVIGGLRPTA